MEQISVDLLNRSGPVVAQHLLFAILDDANNRFARTFQQTTVETGETDSVHAQALQALNDQFVDLPRCRHQKQFQRLAVSITARITGWRGDKTRRMPYLLREGIGFVRAAMHQNATLSGARERRKVGAERVIGDACTAANFDDNHTSSVDR